MKDFFLISPSSVHRSQQLVSGRKLENTSVELPGASHIINSQCFDWVESLPQKFQKISHTKTISTEKTPLTNTNHIVSIHKACKKHPPNPQSSTNSPPKTIQTSLVMPWTRVQRSMNQVLPISEVNFPWRTRLTRRCLPCKVRSTTLFDKGWERTAAELRILK